MNFRNFKKTATLPVLGILLAMLISCQNGQKSNLTLLSNQIPTDTPIIFGPGIVSTDDAKEFSITFNPEMDELYFTRRRPEGDNEIYTMRVNDGQWSKPEPAFFSTDKGWDFEPHINPNGNKLYFGSTRPLSDGVEASGMHQWSCNRSEGGWSQPKPLESPFVDRFVMYITSSQNGNLYFTSDNKDSKPGSEGIYFARNKGDEYANIERMGAEINFPGGEWTAHSYIAPDESYMIFDSQGESGYGDCDLYISFNKNGTWTGPYNFGPKVNTELCEMCASVSPDGKYLFFQRGAEDAGDIYWVDFIALKRHLKNVPS